MRLRRPGRDEDASQRLARLLNAPPQDTSGWVVNRPVEPRPEPDRLNGWVPEPDSSQRRTRRPRPAAAEPEPEMDDLDRFLASQGLDGLNDIDDWNEPAQERRRAGWWSQLSIPWRAAVALVLLGAIAVVFVGVRSMTGPRPGTGVPVPARSGRAAGGAAVTPAATGTVAAVGGSKSPAAAPSSVPAQVTVDVVGQVRRPGVVKLRGGSRVADAVTAAGGLTAQADAQGINLARVLQDGEQVRVPRPGETPSAAAAPAPAGTVEPGSTPTTPAASGASATGAMVNLNTATLEQLDALDGIGPALAQRIIDYRTAHGRFTSVDQLDDVSGIGEKLLARIRPQATV